MIGLTQFEQYVDENTDSVIYAFNKVITLLLSCNPNTIELLGLNPEHYLYLNDIGRMLLDNRKLFLSKRAINSFGGYADAQLRRLQNALARDSFPQSEKEQHIFNSVKNAMHDFNSRYKNFESGSMEIFIDKAINPELETEIFVNANMTHYPLRDYSNMWNTMAKGILRKNIREIFTLFRTMRYIVPNKRRVLFGWSKERYEKILKWSYIFKIRKILS